ncbi:MAG: STAS domain-containing protein [Gammaproteobacteria bacterium]
MQAPPVDATDRHIRLEGELIMQRAEEIKPVLLAALPTDGSVARLDLSQVSEMDTAGLQLLMAANREVIARGATLTIVAASEAVRTTLELFRQGALLAPAATATGATP